VSNDDSHPERFVGFNPNFETSSIKEVFGFKDNIVDNYTTY
jgi:hypothetical protein